MTMRKKRESNSPGFINMGTSLLLVVFLVLALVVFAVLSLSSAQADKNIVDRQVGASENYYRALEDSEELLGDIDRLLAENEEAIKGCESYGRAAFLTELLEELPGGSDADVTADEEGLITISFSVAVDETKYISTKIVLTQRLTEQGPESEYLYEMKSRSCS